MAGQEWIDGLGDSEPVKIALRRYVAMAEAERIYTADRRNDEAERAYQEASDAYHRARSTLTVLERPRFKSLQDEADSTVLLPGPDGRAVIYSWRGRAADNMIHDGLLAAASEDELGAAVAQYYASGWQSLTVTDGNGAEVAGIREPEPRELPGLIQRELFETARWAAVNGDGEGPAALLKAMLSSALAVTELAGLDESAIEDAWSEVREARNGRRPRVAWHGDHVEGQP